MEELKVYEGKMNKTLEGLQSDYAAIRAGRANPHVLDKIKVDYYGTPTPIQQVGNISVPEARMIVIQPWEKSLLKAVEKAILTSELGINPIPYWFINIMAYNAEYLLPLSVRTVNVAYGMSPQLLMKNGWWQCLINIVVTVTIGYVCMQFWPGFGDLVNFTWTP